MKKYIGTREVKATPAIRKGGKVYLPTDGIPKTMDIEEDGYKVVHEDGHESWSPKGVFEKVYKIAETFKDRLIIEQEELDQRLEKLSQFVKSAKFEEIVKDEEQRDLLIRQKELMGEYLKVLNRRIELAD